MAARIKFLIPSTGHHHQHRHQHGHINALDDSDIHCHSYSGAYNSRSVVPQKDDRKKRANPTDMHPPNHRPSPPRSKPTTRNAPTTTKPTATTARTSTSSTATATTTTTTTSPTPTTAASRAPRTTPAALPPTTPPTASVLTSTPAALALMASRRSIPLLLVVGRLRLLAMVTVGLSLNEWEWFCSALRWGARGEGKKLSDVISWDLEFAFNICSASFISFRSTDD